MTLSREDANAHPEVLVREEGVPASTLWSTEHGLYHGLPESIFSRDIYRGMWHSSSKGLSPQAEAPPPRTLDPSQQRQEERSPRRVTKGRACKQTNAREAGFTRAKSRISTPPHESLSPVKRRASGSASSAWVKSSIHAREARFESAP